MSDDLNLRRKIKTPVRPLVLKGASLVLSVFSLYGSASSFKGDVSSFIRVSEVGVPSQLNYCMHKFRSSLIWRYTRGA